MKKGSTWAALKNPVFRRLWVATVISGTCVAAHNNAATWMMNISTGSPFLISLTSALASLPFFLFTLPAGVLADKVNRQLHLARGGNAVPDEPVSGPSALDQLCGKPRREGLRRFIYQR
jgi:MFS family permease